MTEDSEFEIWDFYIHVINGMKWFGTPVTEVIKIMLCSTTVA